MFGSSSEKYRTAPGLVSSFTVAGSGIGFTVLFLQESTSSGFIPLLRHVLYRQPLQRKMEYFRVYTAGLNTNYATPLHLLALVPGVSSEDAGRARAADTAGRLPPLHLL